MLMTFIKAVLVGIAASVPIGPIAILVIQKTLSKGLKPGFVTALGSTFVDVLFSIIAIFALAFVETFISGNPIPVFVGGGLVVIALGVSMSLSNPFRKVKTSPGRPLPAKMPASASDFFTACVMGLSNPGAIVVIFALMAFFGLADDSGSNHDWTCFPVIMGIAAGSASYWLMITMLLNKFRSKFKMQTLIWTNRVMGVIVVVLGIATVAEGIMRIVK